MRGLKRRRKGRRKKRKMMKGKQVSPECTDERTYYETAPDRQRPIIASD